MVNKKWTIFIMCAVLGIHLFMNELLGKKIYSIMKYLYHYLSSFINNLCFMIYVWYFCNDIDCLFALMILWLMAIEYVF